MDTRTVVGLAAMSYGGDLNEENVAAIYAIIVAVCSDGSTFGLDFNTVSPRWKQLPPVPGTQADRK